MTRLWRELHFVPPTPARLVSLEEADAEQDRIIACARWPCETHAGPGAGKSSTIVKKVSRLVEQRDDSWGLTASIAVLTFTNVGKAVLRSRLDAAEIPSELVQVLGTQKVCWQAYKTVHRELKRLSFGKQRQLLGEAIRECNEEKPVNLEKIVREALGYLNEMRELPANLSEIVHPGVVWSYQAKKRQIRGYDDGDVRRWICENPDEIAEYLTAQGVRIVLLDEAQDSSPTEAALLAALVEAGVGVGDVGDLRQVLYEFRGARPELLCNKLRASADYHVHTLRVNRRSRAVPVGELNRFAGKFFDGVKAEEMFALAPGGEPFRAVVCPEQSAVLDVLPRAIGAVDGLVRDPRRAPGGDRALAQALGLPSSLASGESLLIEVANRDDAKEIERVLRDSGYEPVMLVRQEDAPGLFELLHGLCDPEGTTSGPARWYGAASPLCLMLNALRNRPDLKQDKRGPGSKTIDQLITRIRNEEQTRTFEELLTVVLKLLREQGPLPSSRLGRFFEEAVRLLEEWWKIREAERTGELGPGTVLERLLGLVGSTRKEAGTSEERFPIYQYLVDSCGTRHRAAHEISTWLERPALGRSGKNGGIDRSGPPMLYVGVVNQVKGDEADYALVVALDAGRFPYQGQDTHGERCRWWVAISRARYGTAYLGVEGNSQYWPPQVNQGRKEPGEQTGTGYRWCQANKKTISTTVRW